MSINRSKTDWINLPAGVEANSLWCTLHDGDIRAIRSDRLARTMTLEIEIPHLCHHHGLAEEAFTIELEGVVSARATKWVIWPGPVPDTGGISRAEEARLIEEYQSKWREESVGWSDFEAMFAEGSFDISTADAFRDDKSVGLRVGGMMCGDQVEERAVEFTLKASRFAIRHRQDFWIEFERFVELGEDYWEVWSRG
jgi:hypothetical protein